MARTAVVVSVAVLLAGCAQLLGFEESSDSRAGGAKQGERADAESSLLESLDASAEGPVANAFAP